jgi:protein gp37
MATNSPIEWTEATWNPVTGCDKVSPGCAHCYAERMAKRLQGMRQADGSGMGGRYPRSRTWDEMPMTLVSGPHA